MTEYNINFTSYDQKEEESNVIRAESIDSISFSYDGGRVEVLINGKVAISSYLGGNDCNVEIKRN